MVSSDATKYVAFPSVKLQVGQVLHGHACQVDRTVNIGTFVGKYGETYLTKPRKEMHRLLLKVELSFLHLYGRGLRSYKACMYEAGSHAWPH